MNKTKENKKKDTVDVPSDSEPDFSFENEAKRAVDKMFSEASSSDGEKPKLHHITEKIQLGMEIKNEPPDRDFLRVKTEKGIVTFIDRYGEEREEERVIVTSKDIEGVDHVEITKGLFAMDFRNDCNFWHNRSPEVVPAMIKQAVHTHVDIKKCYDMEKRKVDIPLWLILGMVGGGILIVAMVISLLT